MDETNRRSAAEAAALIASGKLTAVKLAEDYLARIATREEAVQAWVHIDPQQVLADARARDAEKPRSPLHGIPVAIKDIIDTADMPTAYGSPIYVGHRPRTDAACVTLLKNAGAVIMGKTVTAEFAMSHPGKTRNPLNAEHTPGGSSSGSAAAVADGMVPIALGTQTGGSVLRPAAFCGIVGFKPTFGAINRAGLKLAAESLDTIGLLARDVEDIELVWNVLVNRAASACALAKPSRVLLFRTHHWGRASDDVVAAVEAAADELSSAGAVIDELPVPSDFAELSDARVIINGYERARALAWEFQHHADRFSPALARVVSDGWSFSYERYRAAIRIAERWRAWIDDRMSGYDAILTAAVNGEAPKGLESTGDASFQEIWTI